MTEFRRGVPEKKVLAACASRGAEGQESIWQVRAPGFGAFLRARLHGDGAEWACLIPVAEGDPVALGLTPSEAWEFRPADPVTFAPRPWSVAADPVPVEGFAVAALVLDALARDFERCAAHPGSGSLGEPDEMLGEAYGREGQLLRRAARYLREPDALRRGGVGR